MIKIYIFKNISLYDDPIGYKYKISHFIKKNCFGRVRAIREWRRHALGEGFKVFLWRKYLNHFSKIVIKGKTYSWHHLWTIPWWPEHKLLSRSAAAGLWKVCNNNNSNDNNDNSGSSHLCLWRSAKSPPFKQPPFVPLSVQIWKQKSRK